MRNCRRPWQDLFPNLPTAEQSPCVPEQHRSILPLLGVVGVLLLPSVPAVAGDGGFSDGKVDFAVQLNGETIPYEVFAVYVLPGKRLPLEILAREPVEGFAVSSDHIALDPTGRRRYLLTSPAVPGVYSLQIRSETSAEVMEIQVFVMMPFRSGQGDSLEGYRIGTYPKTPLRGLQIYEPPTGMIRVIEEDLGRRLSPHFTLGQFLCKQDGGFPKFLVLRERLLMKLEFLLEKLNGKGLRADSFHVMSGFRTPYYNRAIGNVRYSRHQWGGAADIFIDENPKDDVMDDLNHDGRIDRRDAEVLYRLFEGLAKLESYEPLTGGMGLYGSTSNHGPFVHVDARGFRARW